MMKCCSKNIIKNIAEIAIANFLPIDVEKRFFINLNILYKNTHD